MAERGVTLARDMSLERTVLGQVLDHGLAADYQDAGLHRGSFSREAHQAIWGACLDVLDEGGDGTYPLVLASLRATAQLDAIGGPGYLSKLVEAVPKPRPAAIVWQVAQLEDLAADREMTIATDQFADTLLTNREALVDGSLDAHIDALDAIRTRRSSAPPWLDVDGQWGALAEEATRTAEGAVSVGIADLDDVIGGVCAGEVCGFMARPGIGKTVTLANEARVQAFSGQATVFFSLEMPAAQITTRLVQAEYGLSRTQVLERQRGGLLDPSRYRDRFGKFVIVDTPSLSVQQMSQRLRRLQDRVFRDEPIRAVTIDHLGLIGGDRRLGTYDRVSLQSREIKDMAKHHKVAVTLAIQVNRDSGGDGSKELHLGSARDSGVVEEALDYLIGIRRFDRSSALTVPERERYRDALFYKFLKTRHQSLPDREMAVRFDYTLNLEPARDLTVPDVADKANHFAGSKR